MSKETFLTIEEVAQRYRVSEVTIGRWWRAGTIPHPMRFGRRMIRWCLADLMAAEQQRQAGASAAAQPGGQHVQCSN